MAGASNADMRNLEDLLARIGNANRFQLIMGFYVKGSAALISWTMYEMSFVKAEPDWCCIPEHIPHTSVGNCHSGNISSEEKCHIDFSNCSSRLFEDNLNTMVNEWELVCNDKWKVNFSISAQMVGILFSAMATGHVANQIGRKKTLFLSLSSLMVFSFLTGFSTSWEMFTMFRILLGVSCGIYFVVSMPFAMEFLSPTMRHIPAVLPVFTSGIMFMAVAAYLLRDWRWLHWVCAGLALPFLSLWFFVPESLRWLTVQGKLDEAENVVAYIARVNKKDVPVGCRQVLEAIYEQECKVQVDEYQTYNYIDIYRGWYLFKLSVSLQVIWFSFSLCTYGIVFSASTLGLNLYLNLFLFSAVTIPVLIVMLIVSHRVGRKSIALFLLSVSTLCGLASLLIDQTVPDKELRVKIINVLCLVVKSTLAGAWISVALMNNESYPTVLRSLGYAASNTMARIGGILAPFAFDFKTKPVLAYALIASTMGLCIVLVFFLNETNGTDLPDTMEEIERAKEARKEKKLQRKKLLPKSTLIYGRQ